MFISVPAHDMAEFTFDLSYIWKFDEVGTYTVIASKGILFDKNTRVGRCLKPVTDFSGGYKYRHQNEFSVPAMNVPASGRKGRASKNEVNNDFRLFR